MNNHHVVPAAAADRYLVAVTKSAEEAKSIIESQKGCRTMVHEQTTYIILGKLGESELECSGKFNKLDSIRVMKRETLIP